MRVQILGAHNCESLNSRCAGLLVDDVLAIDGGGLTSSLSLELQLKLVSVLLTHKHYDHVKDIPALAMNFFLAGGSIDIYATSYTTDAVLSHLLDGELYPDFRKEPPDRPAVKFNELEPGNTVIIDSYAVLPVPVAHSVPAVGYQIASQDGKVLFYTGDTGPGLADCWQYISPQLLVIEVTAPDRFEEFGWQSGHLTPNLLKEELLSFQALKGYLPRVVLVHMTPALEKEIAGEIATVARDLNSPITLASEGMRFEL